MFRKLMRVKTPLSVCYPLLTLLRTAKLIFFHGQDRIRRPLLDLQQRRSYP
jgi:hypothetical protein